MSDKPQNLPEKRRPRGRGSRGRFILDPVTRGGALHETGTKLENFLNREGS